MSEQIEVFSFDVNTKQAQQQVAALLAEYRALQKQQQELQKSGKDTAAVDAQIAAAKEKLTRVTNQQTTTERGAAAQRRASRKVLKEYENSLDDATRKTDNLSNANKRGALSFTKNLAGAKNFTSVLARGSAGLANFVGGFGLQGVALGALAGVFDKVTTSVIDYFSNTQQATERQQRLKDATDALAQSLSEETRQNNGLFDALRSGETDQKTRVAIAEKLNEEYPEIIGNTNLLTASEEELNAIQNKVNGAIRARLILQAQEAQAAEIVAEITKRTIEAVQEADQRLLETASSSNDRARTASRVRQEIEALERTKNRTEQQELLLKALRDEQKAINAKRASERESIKNSLLESKGVNGLKRELESLPAIYKELDAVLAGIDFGSSFTAADDASKAADKSSKATKDSAAAQRDLAGSLAASRAELARLVKEQEAQTALGDKERIDQLGVSIRFYTEEVKKGEEALKRANEPTQVYVRSISEINKALTETQRLLDEQVDAKDLAAVASYTAQINKLKKELEDAELARKALSEPLLPPPPSANQEIVRSATQQLEVAKLSIEDLALARNRALLQLQQEENAAIAAAGKNEEKRQKIAEQFANRRKLLDVQTQQQVLAARIEAAEKELALTQATGEAEIDKLAAQRSEIVELQRQLAELQGQEYTISLEVDDKKTKKSIKETVLQIADLTEQISSQVVDFVSSRNQAAIATADAAINKQEEVLNRLLENEETANVEQVRLEQERLDKLNQERERAKEREGVIAQAQIAINLALAVARAAAEGGGIASAATIAIALSAAIFGFLKAKQASSQAFAEGTMYVKRGKGEPRGRDTVKAQLDEGESVFSKEKTKEYNPILRAIFDGTIAPEVANGFVQGEHVSDYTHAPTRKAVSTFRKLEAEREAAKYFFAQPISSGADTEAIAAEIRKIPRQIIKGGEIYTVYQSQSSKKDNQRKRARGY